MAMVMVSNTSLLEQNERAEGHQIHPLDFPPLFNMGDNFSSTLLL